jgi:hypothetical protein
MFRRTRHNKKTFHFTALRDEDVCALCPEGTPKAIEGQVYGLCDDHISDLAGKSLNKYRMQKTIAIPEWGIVFENERVKLPKAVADDWLKYDWVRKENFLEMLGGLFS